MALAHQRLMENGLMMSAEEFAAFGDSVFKRYEEAEAREDRDISDLVKYQDIVDTLLPTLPKARRERLALEAKKAFWDAAVKSYPIRKSARQALEGLRSKGLRMGVVSNHHDYESLLGHLEDSGIRSHFEVVLASEREGIRKPSRAIFVKSLRAMGVESEHAIFVGDSPRHDIMGAQGAGITAVLIDDGEHKDSWAHQKAEGEPEYVIDDLLALHDVLDDLRGGSRAKSRRRTRSA